MLASMSGFKVQQIDHVELFVPDQRIAAAWYARVFGMRVLTELEHWADGGPLIIATPKAQTKLALFEGALRYVTTAGSITAPPCRSTSSTPGTTVSRSRPTRPRAPTPSSNDP